ncbi:MAG TPA: PKD domain-containing protein [Thermoanaerobaculia bacterium]|nr:PKD domain-containing protein [Thermoanaerobaculia bacterium]
MISNGHVRVAPGTALWLAPALLILGFGLSPALAQSDVALERIEAHAQNRPLASLRDAVASLADRRPVPAPPREIVNFRGEGVPAPSGTSGPDAALQTSAATAATSVSSGFFGASNNDNGRLLGFLVAPPDTDGAVGPSHFVQMINLLTTVFDKSGNKIGDSFASNAFWSGQGGNCEPNNQGDPIVLYDDVADRWLVSQFAFPDSFSSFSQCVAISQSGDPLGGYNRYEFSFDGIGFNDYPKHGIVSDSITMIANIFRARGPFFNFAGTFLGVMDKAAMYAGQPASLIGFNIGTGEFGFVAGDLDGSGSAPALFGTAMSQTSRFDVWEIDVAWPSGSASASRIASLPISAYDADLCSASREACIPQPDGGPALEAISDRLMHRLQIRDFGAYRTMVTGHTVDVGGGRAGVRWYELRESGGTWSLHQQGTYAPNDGKHRWMPSVAMNAVGDIGIGYLLASTNTYVSTAVSGQSAANSGTGALDAAEQICAAGSGVQLDVARAGDYSATSIDPISDTFWHTNEVFTQTGQFQWNTFVCEFTVGGGNLPPTASFTYTCTDLACSFDGSGSSDSDGTISSYDWAFGDNATGSGATASHTYSAEGSYTVTLTVTDDGGATGSTSQTVTVSDGINDPPIASFTFTCADLACSFDGSASSDGDGTISSYDWAFGDNATGSGVTTSHTYAAAGDYTVILTVTDDGSATDTDTQTVSVNEPAAISLSATGYKVRGAQHADLAWSGATSTNVDVYRNGVIIVTTANDGAHTDNIGNRGGGSYTYQVCEAGTSTCSNQVTVTF